MKKIHKPRHGIKSNKYGTQLHIKLVARRVHNINTKVHSK